ncbi:TIGR02300 family protein [Saccharibacter floricola]|nr:TIGR02300 family protein [Saccharibacter floricola]
MAKPELGLKRTCVDCNARFYDLNRVPAVCPKCGTTQPSNLSRLQQHEEALPNEKEKELDQNEHENDVDLDTAGDDDDDVISPDDDLDDDDISNDIEVTTDKDDRDDS